MKKWLTVILCLVLCLCLFGCGENRSGDATTTVATTITTSPSTNSASTYYHPTPDEYRSALVAAWPSNPVSSGSITNGIYSLTVGDFISVQCGLNDNRRIESVMTTIDYSDAALDKQEGASYALVIIGESICAILNSQPGVSYTAYDISKGWLAVATSQSNTQGAPILNCSKVYNGCKTSAAVSYETKVAVGGIVIPE